MVANSIGWNWGFWLEGCAMVPLVIVISQQPHALRGNPMGRDPPNWCDEVKAILSSRQRTHAGGGGFLGVLTSGSAVVRLWFRQDLRVGDAGVRCFHGRHDRAGDLRADLHPGRSLTPTLTLTLNP